MADQAEPASGACFARLVGALEHDGDDELAVDGVMMIGRDVPVEFVGGDEHQHLGDFFLEPPVAGVSVCAMAGRRTPDTDIVHEGCHNVAVCIGGVRWRRCV